MDLAPHYKGPRKNVMKQILSSLVLAGAIVLPAATVASAAQRAGGHGSAGHAQVRVAPHASGQVVVGRPVLPHYVIVRPYGYGFWRPYGFYDPFWYGWGYPYYPYYDAPEAVTGGLRLEVKPKTAQVFVDGGYA